MARIRVNVDTPITDGSEVVFIAPRDCSEIAMLEVHQTIEDSTYSFIFKDAHGYDLSDVDNLFTEGVYVKVILNTSEGVAYIQNADTNKYLESRFKELGENHDKLFNDIIDGTGKSVIDVITWDGSIDGLEEFKHLDEQGVATTYYKVSDKTPSYLDLQSVGRLVFRELNSMAGTDIETVLDDLILTDLRETEGCCSLLAKNYYELGIRVFYEGNSAGVSSGVYFVYSRVSKTQSWISYLEFNGSMLRQECLPEECFGDGQKEVRITWNNGIIDGLPSYHHVDDDYRGGDYYKVSDVTPSYEELCKIKELFCTSSNETNTPSQDITSSIFGLQNYTEEANLVNGYKGYCYLESCFLVVYEGNNLIKYEDDSSKSSVEPGFYLCHYPLYGYDENNELVEVGYKWISSVVYDAPTRVLKDDSLPIVIGSDTVTWDGNKDVENNGGYYKVSDSTPSYAELLKGAEVIALNTNSSPVKYEVDLTYSDSTKCCKLNSGGSYFVTVAYEGNSLGLSAGVYFRYNARSLTIKDYTGFPPVLKSEYLPKPIHEEFLGEKGDTLFWNGDFTNLINYESGESRYVKVSDATPSYEDLLKGVIVTGTQLSSGTYFDSTDKINTTDIRNLIESYGYCIVTVSKSIRVMIYYEGNTKGYEPGTYFYWSNTFYTSRFIVKGYTGFITATIQGCAVPKKLDYNLLPETGAEAGKYGGFDSSSKSYKVPEIIVDKYGRILYVSQSVVPQASTENDGFITKDAYNYGLNFESDWSMFLKAGKTSYTDMFRVEVPVGSPLPTIYAYGRNSEGTIIVPLNWTMKLKSETDTIVTYIISISIPEALDYDLYCYIRSSHYSCGTTM